MSCVLRISAPGIEAALETRSFPPYRYQDGWAHFAVSEAGFRELDAQIEDAIAFLKRHKEDVARLMDLPSAQGWLDFGIADRNGPARADRVSPDLVCLAGKAGIGIETFTYRDEAAEGRIP
jgi:hypothetical protein